MTNATTGSFPGALIRTPRPLHAALRSPAAHTPLESLLHAYLDGHSHHLHRLSVYVYRRAGVAEQSCSSTLSIRHRDDAPLARALGNRTWSVRMHVAAPKPLVAGQGSSFPLEVRGTEVAVCGDTSPVTRRFTSLLARKFSCATRS